MILNINLIYLSPGYYTSVPKLLILTPAQSPDSNPIENLWVHLQKKVGKISPINKDELNWFIK